MKKIGLFFGGLSNEAQVSVSSAKNIIKNFDYKKYDLVLVYWHKDGFFYNPKNIEDIKDVSKLKRIFMESFKGLFDIAFIITHGKYGEDGSLQGFFELQKIKYCGCRILGSALCMDKIVFKEMIKGTDINQVRFYSFGLSGLNKKDLLDIVEKIKKSFKLPFYIKPSNSGSSVGITKIENYKEIERAIKEAGKHDNKILIEEGLISSREIEVAVVGNNDLIVSEPGEIILKKDFYSYDDKYVLGETEIVIPAKLNKKQKREIKIITEKVYKLCDCKGFARVDFFINDNKIFLNEINTLPGFTDISMFPMLLKNAEISYRNLINKIINLAY